MTRTLLPWRLCAALLVSAWSAAAPAAGLRPISADDIVDLRHVDDPQISADGRQVAYVLKTPRDNGKPPLSRLWLVDTAAGAASAHALTDAGSSAAGETSPRWSPDGAWIGFLSDRGKTQDPRPACAPGDAAADADAPSMQVWRIARSGGTPQQLTAAAGAVSAFAWSADGKSLAWIATDPPSAERKARLQRKDDAQQVDHDAAFDRVWVRDLPDGAPRALTAPGLQVSQLAWSPDGTKLALRVADAPGFNGYWNRSRLLLVDAADGHLLRVVATDVGAQPPRWSPDGSQLLYAALSRGKMTSTLLAHRLADDRRVRLAPDWDGTLWHAQWRDDAHIVAEGQRGLRAEFLQVDADSGKARTLAATHAAWAAFTLARDGRVAFLGETPTAPAEIWLLRDGRTHALTDSNPQVRQWALGTLRELSWRSSRDGRRIDGVLVLPPGWKAGTPLPTLLQIHGGPAWAWWSGWLGSWHDWAQLLASHGYAVLLPNPRGSEGQGAAFTEAANNDWGGGDYQDVLDGLDAIVAQRIADPARVAIGGWSYGGYLAAWAATHDPQRRFRTAIVGAGVTDLYSMALTTDVHDFLPGYFGRDALAARAMLDERSPLRYAERVRMPVLILHGEQDQRVPLAQGQMLYQALKTNGTPVQMVTYPRSTHWPEERDLQRDLLQQVARWLDKELAVGATSDRSGDAKPAPVQ